MSSAKKRGLGRGLGSLIPTQAVPTDAPDAADVQEAVLPKASTKAASKTQGKAPATKASKPASAKTAADSKTTTKAKPKTTAQPESTPTPTPARASGDGSRPSDMFFAGGPAKSSQKRGNAWDSAISSGRLGIGRDVSRETKPAAADEPSASAAEGDGALVPVPGAQFAEIPLDLIRPNSKQPRTVFDESDLEELTASVTEIGVLQPVVVRPDPLAEGRYELIMGERRFRASKRAGQDTVPAIIRKTDDVDLLRDALLENLHRAQLNPLEEASAYRQMIDDFGCTQEELARRIARSRPQISNTLRLLNLPPLVQRRVAAGVLSAGHARALLGLEDAAAMERLAQRIVAEGLSVRSTEEIVALAGTEKPTKGRTARNGSTSPAVTELAGRLSDLLDTRVKVQVGKSKGRMVIEFAAVEDLNRILNVMAPSDPGLTES